MDAHFYFLYRCHGGKCGKASVLSEDYSLANLQILRRSYCFTLFPIFFNRPACCWVVTPFCHHSSTPLCIIFLFLLLFLSLQQIIFTYYQQHTSITKFKFQSPNIIKSHSYKFKNGHRRLFSFSRNYLFIMTIKLQNIL